MYICFIWIFVKKINPLGSRETYATRACLIKIQKWPILAKMTKIWLCLAISGLKGFQKKKEKKIVKILKIYIFVLSTKSLETLGVTSVRTFVRTCVTLFPGNCSILFSVTLQLVRACKCEKNVPCAFLIIFTVLPFWPKTVQILIGA